MVTVTEDSGKQSLPLDTSTLATPSVNSELPDLHPTTTTPNSSLLPDPIKSSQQHNFRSMADLIRSQGNNSVLAPHELDMTSSRDVTKSDENENSVQDLRLNGQQRGGCNSSLTLREEHLRRWYSGDLGGGGGGANDGSSFMVDVDGQSSHSGIPSDLSSDADQAEIDAVQKELETSKDLGDELDETIDVPVAVRQQNGDTSGVVLKLSSPPSDMDAMSDTEIDMRKSKRKQYTPKQRDSVRTPGTDEPPNKARKLGHCTLQHQLQLMQQQLFEMQNKVLHLGPNDAEANKSKSDLFTPPGMNLSNRESTQLKLLQNQSNSLLSPLGVKVNLNRNLDSKFPQYKNNAHTSPIQGDTPKDLEDLAKTLKTELTSQVGTMVDTIMAKYAESRKKIADSPPKENKTPITASLPNGEPRTPVHNTSVNTSPSHQVNNHSPHHAVVSDRPVLNLSPRIMPTEHMQQRHHQHHHPANTLLDNMKNFPFPFNKPKQEFPEQQQQHKQLHPENKVEVPKPQKPMKLNDKLGGGMPHFFDPARAFGEFHRPSPWFPHLPFYPPAQVPTHHALHAAFGNAFSKEQQEQTEALPLVVGSPKKKRTKVTDTRLSPRAARALLQEPVPAEQPMMHHPHGLSPLGASTPVDRKEIPMPPTSFHTPLIPASLPTSVAIPNPSLQHSELFGSLYGHHKNHDNIFSRVAAAAAQAEGNMFTPSTRSPPVRDDSHSPIYTPSDSPSFFRDSNGFGNGGGEETMTADGFPFTSTLTPMHLRKAKLMFFFVRYPSSSIIKVYFPDVKFNKNNTAQLVKWFSNFREFYYIQMEKYARQAIAEGVKNPEDIMITTDSEIYRVLNLHYNRNNQLEVPEGFRITVQATLREFYKAVVLNKDTEQSWKKPIYKIIARMDDAVPDYFKSPNWMEQLND